MSEEIDLLHKIHEELRAIRELLAPKVFERLPDWILLPDHLRKTIMPVMKYTQLTADGIANCTKRARAVESGYANQLVTMGYLKKETVGHKVYFSIDLLDKY